MGASGCCVRRRLLIIALVLVQRVSPLAGFAAPAPGSPKLKQYYASCSQGLADVLEQELLGPGIGATKTEALKRGVRFLGDEAMGYRALINSRVANSVWQLMARQRGIRGREDIYALASRVDFEDAMRVDQVRGEPK